MQRLVLPETRTLALVEMQEPGQARQAFKGLAYKGLHHVPLFLEWAPKGIFAPTAPTLQDPQVRSCACVTACMCGKGLAYRSLDRVPLLPEWATGASLRLTLPHSRTCSCTLCARSCFRDLHVRAGCIPAVIVVAGPTAV